MPSHNLFSSKLLLFSILSRRNRERNKIFFFFVTTERGNKNQILIKTTTISLAPCLIYYRINWTFTIIIIIINFIWDCNITSGENKYSVMN